MSLLCTLSHFLLLPWLRSKDRPLEMFFLPFCEPLVASAQLGGCFSLCWCQKHRRRVTESSPVQSLLPKPARLHDPLSVLLPGSPPEGKTDKLVATGLTVELKSCISGGFFGFLQLLLRSNWVVLMVTNSHPCWPKGHVTGPRWSSSFLKCSLIEQTVILLLRPSQVGGCQGPHPGAA